MSTFEAKPAGYYGEGRGDLISRLRRPAGRVLDVGCAEGAAEGPLRDAGATEITGIELLPEPAAVAATRYDRVVVGDALASLDEIDGPFDTVLCLDVIEHVVDPGALLAALRARTVSGGQLLLSTPNARHWSLVRDLVLRGTFGYTAFGHRDETHLRWFTRDDLDALLVRSGWQPESWWSSALQFLANRRIPPRWLPRLGSEFGAGQWFVAARAA